MRSDLHDEHRRVGREDGLDRRWPHYLLILLPRRQTILYSSTHLGGKQCPPRPDFSQGYVWAVYDTFDIFTANPDGSDLKQLTNTPGYDAETTINRQGKLVFTSKRDGDLDIYTMDADGKNVKRLTNELGYDGGPFWSYDGKQIVYRAYHPQTEKEKADYTALLKQNLIRPTVAGDLGDECGRIEQAPGHQSEQGELCALLFSRRQAHHLCVEHRRSEGPRFRSLHDQRRRHRAGAHHIQRHVRRFSDVFAGREEAGVCFESADAKQGDTNMFIADWVE